jgi:hypothetical protein
VPRFAYVSAHVPAIPGFEYVMEGYVKGKRQAEEELFREYPEGGRGADRGVPVAAPRRPRVRAAKTRPCRRRPGLLMLVASGPAGANGALDAVPWPIGGLPRTRSTAAPLDAPPL